MNTCHLTTRELHFESQGTGDVVELGGASLTSKKVTRRRVLAAVVSAEACSTRFCSDPACVDTFVNASFHFGPRT